MTKNIDHTALGLPPLPSSSHDTIAALMWAREVLQKRQTTTYAVTDPKGIEELKPVKIGAIDQWLHIRGRNRNNPVLLYLHGGPGGPMIGNMDAIQRPWEDYFTIVHWDQRQTGKSYYPADDVNNPLTLNQIVEDTEELIQYLRDYLKKDKLFVLGHSWGSVLGMHVIKRHPEWFHAYIGVGQVVNMVNGEYAAYQRLLSHAREQNESELVSKMETITSFFLDAKSPEREKCFVENCVFVRRELSRLAGESSMHHTFFDYVIENWSFNNLISPHLTLTDISHSIIGDETALVRPPYTFTQDIMSIDLPNDLGNTFEVPIFFFSGVYDYQTPVPLSDKWFGQINSTYKELIHFKESSHFIVNEEPGRVLTALVTKVLPFADAENHREIDNG